MERYTRKIIIYFAKVIISTFMFRLFPLFVLLLHCTDLAFGQDTINAIDSRGNKVGFWRKFDSSGNKTYEGHFKNGIPIGEFRYFYRSGKVKALSIYYDNGKRARSISYFPGGMKMAAGNYLNEKKDSIWQFFSQIDGILLSEEEYKAGLKTGLSKTYFLQGGIAGISTWKDGIRDGLWEEYYSDGKVKLRGTFRNNEKEGPIEAFYSSGKLLLTGQYANGHQDGTWIYYEENGTISKQETYEDGMLVIPKK